MKRKVTTDEVRAMIVKAEANCTKVIEAQPAYRDDIIDDCKKSRGWYRSLIRRGDKRAMGEFLCVINAQ